jgi:hypothetical protein
LERIGLIGKIFDSEADIDRGRKWLDTDGLEHAGRMSYHKGITSAMDAFREVQSKVSLDLEALVLAERGFISQELQLCDPTDTQTASSLTQAIQSFDDALLVLGIVTDSAVYRGAELSHPHRQPYRYKDMPNDAFHIACKGHFTRLGNIIKSPGINLAEKELLRQRQSNLLAAQTAYLEKQKTALAEGDEPN